MEEARKLIERIVRQEIRATLADSDKIIKEVIETSFYPELKSAIHDALQMELVSMMAKYPGINENVADPEESSAAIKNKPDTLSETETSPEPVACDCGTHSHSDAFPETSSDNEVQSSNDERGRYIYCLVENDEDIDFGEIGIDGNRVYSIPWKDISAIVHNCPEEPYKSEDQDVVEKWVLKHQEVIDVVWEKFGTVLPLGFDTIIQGKDGTSPDGNTGNWLKEDYNNLKEKFKKIRGKAEYGVQVFMNPQVMAQKISKESQAIRDMEETIQSKPRGLAYMYQQKLENLLKAEMEKEADSRFKDFFERIKNCVDEIKVEKVKKPEGNKHMLLNFSCLLPKEESEILGNELEKIDNMEGFSVRYTGPWPPYGFV